MTSLGLFGVIPSMQLSLRSRGWTPAAEVLKVQAEESSKGSVLGDALPTLLGRLSTALTHGRKSECKQNSSREQEKQKPVGTPYKQSTVASYPNPTLV